MKAEFYDHIPSEIKDEIMEFDPMIITRMINAGESKTALKFLKRIEGKNAKSLGISKDDLIEMQIAAIMKNDRLVTSHLLTMHKEPMLRRAIISEHPQMVLIVLRNGNHDITSFQKIRRIIYIWLY